MVGSQNVRHLRSRNILQINADSSNVSTLWWSSFHFLWFNFDDIYIILTSQKSADSIYCSEDDYYINLPNASSNRFYQVNLDLTDFHDKIIGLSGQFPAYAFRCCRDDQLFCCNSVLLTVRIFMWARWSLYQPARNPQQMADTQTPHHHPGPVPPGKGKIKHWNFYWQGRYNLTLMGFITI